MKEYSNDKSNYLLSKIEIWLIREMKNSGEYHKVTDGTADILQGRYESASCLQYMINKWKAR